MKIRLKDNATYAGLLGIQFPVVIEAARINYNDTASVKFNVMESIPGFRWDDWDAAKGSDYVFLRGEYEIVKDEEDVNTAEQLLHAKTPSEEEGVERKRSLVALIREYGDAISRECYESECGVGDELEQCEAEVKRLFTEIEKMIEAGV